MPGEKHRETCFHRHHSNPGAFRTGDCKRSGGNCTIWSWAKHFYYCSCSKTVRAVFYCAILARTAIILKIHCNNAYTCLSKWTVIETLQLQRWWFSIAFVFVARSSLQQIYRRVRDANCLRIFPNRLAESPRGQLCPFERAAYGRTEIRPRSVPPHRVVFSTRCGVRFFPRFALTYTLDTDPATHGTFSSAFFSKRLIPGKERRPDSRRCI